MAKKATDDQILTAYNKTSSVWKAGKLLGMCGQSVHERLVRLGAINSTAWSEEEDKMLALLYGKCEKRGFLNEIADKMGRTRASVAGRASKLGLTKYSRPLSESTKKKISKNSSEWIKKHGHPRGYLGKKHSPDTRKLLGICSGRFWNNATKEDIVKRTRKALATRKENGTSNTSGVNTFSRCRRGKRDDIGDIFFRSSWEANYARYLNMLISMGEIAGWEYEVDRFWFDKEDGVMSFLPDFKVMMTNGACEYHEVKGWMTERSRESLRLMDKYYPDIKLVLIDKNAYMEIDKRKSVQIPHWE